MAEFDPIPANRLPSLDTLNAHLPPDHATDGGFGTPAEMCMQLLVDAHQRDPGLTRLRNLNDMSDEGIIRAFAEMSRSVLEGNLGNSDMRRFLAASVLHPDRHSSPHMEVNATRAFDRIHMLAMDDPTAYRIPIGNFASNAMMNAGTNAGILSSIKPGLVLPIIPRG